MINKINHALGLDLQRLKNPAFTSTLAVVERNPIAHPVKETDDTTVFMTLKSLNDISQGDWLCVTSDAKPGVWFASPKHMHPQLVEAGIVVSAQLAAKLSKHGEFLDYDVAKSVATIRIVQPTQVKINLNKYMLARAPMYGTDHAIRSIVPLYSPAASDAADTPVARNMANNYVYEIKGGASAVERVRMTDLAAEIGTFAYSLIRVYDKHTVAVHGGRVPLYYKQL